MLNTPISPQSGLSRQFTKRLLIIFGLVIAVVFGAASTNYLNLVKQEQANALAVLAEPYQTALADVVLTTTMSQAQGLELLQGLQVQDSDELALTHNTAQWARLDATSSANHFVALTLPLTKSFELHVKRHFTPLIPYNAYVVKPLVVIATLMVLIWFILGRWVKQLTQRITAFDDAVCLIGADDQSRGWLRLEQVAKKSDELGHLSRHFKQMFTALKAQSEQSQRHIQTLSLLEEAVIELDETGHLRAMSEGWGKLVSDQANSQFEQYMDADDVPMWREKFAQLVTNQKQLIHLRVRLQHAQNCRWVDAKFIKNPDHKITGVLRDITQSYLQEKKISHLAFHDVLTGLPNRVLLDDRMQQAMVAAKRAGEKVGVLFFDLDHFKNINDSFGHKTGDALLVAIAQRLQGIIRQGDTLCRWGGDEFLLLATGINAVQDCAQIMQHLIEVTSPVFQFEQQELAVSFSLGAAVYPDDGDTVEQLLSNADRAMFYAKSQGRNQGALYADLTSKGLGKKQIYIQTRLKKAIVNHDIAVWFQPIVDAQTGQCISAEVLARWHDEEEGWISPAIFIPMAESMGMICELGYWVLNQSIQALSQWHQQGYGFSLAINVSSRQLFEADFGRRLTEMLANQGLKPHDIVVEVTESIALRDIEHSFETLKALRKQGFKISIDDFGTGHSSLSQLQDLDADKLKIDMSFVQMLDSDNPKGLSIVTTIIQMAKAMGLKTVAEGVENQHQAAQLKALGADYFQGYYFAKPMPHDAFTQWLIKHDLP
jgi:diguanylate cyclase (GGDEF)-like protein